MLLYILLQRGAELLTERLGFKCRGGLAAELFLQGFSP